MYATINNFGAKSQMSAQSNPLSYCAVTALDSGFNHTLGAGSSLLAPQSTQCQRFMAGYCSAKWDGICEYMSKDVERGGLANGNSIVQSGFNSCFSPGVGSALTRGEILIRNSAQERFLKAMSDNCFRDYQPFDPTVGDSPMVGVWKLKPNQSGVCIPIYALQGNPDQDVLIDKLLQKPWIALDILMGLYQTTDLNSIKGTKLYNFFTSQQFKNLMNTQ